MNFYCFKFMYDFSGALISALARLKYANDWPLWSKKTKTKTFLYNCRLILQQVDSDLISGT